MKKLILLLMVWLMYGYTHGQIRKDFTVEQVSATIGVTGSFDILLVEKEKLPTSLISALGM